MARILVVGLNPTLQKTLVVSDLQTGEVNRSSVYYFDASGKGANVARVLSQLGASATYLCQLGGDGGHSFAAMARRSGMQLSLVESGVEPRNCLTVVDTAAGHATEIIEETDTVAPDTEQRVIDRFSDLVADHDWVVIAGSKARGFSQDIYPALVSRARAAGVPVLCDYRGPELLACIDIGVDVVKMNREEFLETFVSDRAAADLPDDLAGRVGALSSESGALVVVTAGAGAVVCAAEGSSMVVPVEPLVPRNPTGSGDAFAAGLVCSLAAGRGLEEAVEEAIRCGRDNALQIRPGTLRPPG